MREGEEGTTGKVGWERVKASKKRKEWTRDIEG